MDVNSPYFTVFTPTYNRAHCLYRVYESLVSQSFQDFEWVIIDDGSTDGTKNVVDSFVNDRLINIRYFYQPNGHKKTAFNHGVKEAKGFLFIPADSDDSFDDNTLEIFKKTYEGQSKDTQNLISGITCLCKDENGLIIGDKYPFDEWLSDIFEMRYKYKVKGEKWCCIKTEILHSYPFPEEVKGHVPENIVWTPIANKYKTIFINKPLRTYFTDSVDGLTNTVKGFSKNNSHGHFLLSKITLELEFKYFMHHPSIFLKAACNYTRFKLSMSHSESKMPVSRLLYNRTIALLLITILSPVGFILFLRDKNNNE